VEKLKNFALKKTVLFSIILICTAVFFTEIPLDRYFTFFANKQYNNYFIGTFEQIFVSLMLVLLLIKFGILKDAGLRKFNSWKDLWIGWPLVVLIVINGWSIFDGSLTIDTSKPLLITLYTITYLSTGLFEELLCRGVVLIVMLHKWGDSKKGIYISVIASSILFGVTHIINFALGRSTLIATFTQIAFGFFIGVFFAAYFLRIRSIWPAIILHAAFNMCGSLQDIAIGGGLRAGVYSMTLGDAIANILVTLPFLIYGLYILRKVIMSDTLINSMEDLSD